MKKKFYSFLLFFAWLPHYALAAPVLGVEAGRQTETITLSVPQVEPYKLFTLASPDRLVVDVPALTKIPGVGLPKYYKGRLITRVRAGRFDAETLRFVFELSGKIQIVSQELQGDALVITIAPAGAKIKKALPKPLVMIDPGHGGVDPGAIGDRGLQEKNIVLSYARALQDQLLKTGRYRVKLTRDSDTFIMLRQRIAIAREEKADIFISLHADSSPDTARGLSVYTLSEKASDDEAEALAQRENKADILAGVDLNDERKDVADILISLAQRETNNRSALLADSLVAAFSGRVKLLPNTHRFAGFAVLKAPDIPSVLVETGFISHPAEEKLLQTAVHRDKVVGGMVAGVDRYFSLREEWSAP